MKCILIKDGKGPAENLYLGEEETPSPKNGEVLVKIKVHYIFQRSIWIGQGGD